MAKRTPARRRPPEEHFSRGLPVTDEFLEVWRKNAARREIGRKLERMRRDANLTQAELAARMGKDQAFVARMESGRGDMPKAENIALFADRCGFATAYAFVALAPDDGMTLHELQPICQDEEAASKLQAVHDVRLPGRAAAALEE